MLERIPIADISRVTDISESYLQNYINNKYEETPQKIEIIKGKGLLTLECDEMWSFVGKKDDKYRIWLAIDVESRKIIGVFVGSRDRIRAEGLWNSSRLYIANVLLVTRIIGLLTIQFFLKKGINQ